MKIEKITIIRKLGCCDKVYIKTDLPSPTPGLSQSPLILYFGVEYDNGENYVREHFKVEPEVIREKT